MKLLKEFRSSLGLWVYKNVIKIAMMCSGLFIVFLTSIGIPSIENSFEKMEITDIIGELFIRVVVAVILSFFIFFFWRKHGRRKNYLIAIYLGERLIEKIKKEEIFSLKEKIHLINKTNSLILLKREKESRLCLIGWVERIEKLILKRENLFIKTSEDTNEYLHLNKVECRKYWMEYSLAKYLN